MIILKFVGTDAYLMNNYMPYMGWKWKLKTVFNRIVYKILDKFVSEIIVDDIYLSKHLVEAGFTSSIREVRDPVKYPQPIVKVKHKGFNVLYYNPTKHKKNKNTIRWIYGIDIIEQLKDEYTNINWIEVDGEQDMNEVWSITDFYLRPNRSDAASRMVQEALINNIPYYHSQFNPDYGTIKLKLNEIIKTRN